MIRNRIIDQYFQDQPPLEFVEDLKVNAPLRVDMKKRAATDEVRMQGFYISANDFENERLLRTVFDDFERFTDENSLKGDTLPLRILQNSSFDEKSYCISVKENAVDIEANNVQCIRRAVIRLEDFIVTHNGYLQKGEYKEKIVLDDLISRCFFSPINRPPKCIDELASEEDFYPDGYLNKLMHDGVNCIWIMSNFASLIESSYITEFGQDSGRRITKLNKTIEKCALYGIEVYLFLIEPMSLMEGELTMKFPDLHKKYPQVMGNSALGPTAFCTYTEFGEKYLAEAVKNLFISAPKLGGMISITQGERVTSCATIWRDNKGNWRNNCPHCKDKSQSQIVAHTVKIIVEAMKSVAPKAKFISWTYGHRGRPLEVIKEYTERISKDAVMMQNFEDDGRVYQLGKKRFALDYFLSYAGPSGMFTFTAEHAKHNNKTLYAKMQVCCSHEVATMPFIPVPGIIYDKITSAKKLGVTGIMESWFFGNYPCLMSKAVELLSTDKEYKSKIEFIKTIASLYFKKKNVEKVSKAFLRFEKGYTNYPVNVMFNYYGPMHDGIVWDYALKPHNFSLPRTWKLEDIPDGDRIGECLYNGHTIDEAIILCQKLVEDWESGCRLLEEIDEENEIIEVAFALRLLFKSGLNALLFYNYRDALGYGLGKSAKDILAIMKNILLEEISNSQKMMELCKKNKSFGYHSEAEGYKFFPAKLKDRIEKLQVLLETEFAEVEDRIAAKLAPLEYYEGIEDGARFYKAGACLEKAEWQDLDDGKSKFKVAITETEVQVELKSEERVDFFVCNEFRLMFPQSTYQFTHSGEKLIHRDGWSHQSLLDEKINAYLSLWEVKNLAVGEETHLLLVGQKTAVGYIKRPYKFLVKTTKGGSWCKDMQPVRVLGKTTQTPGDFGWIL